MISYLICIIFRYSGCKIMIFSQTVQPYSYMDELQLSKYYSSDGRYGCGEWSLESERSRIKFGEERPERGVNIDIYVYILEILEWRYNPRCGITLYYIAAVGMPTLSHT